MVKNNEVLVGENGEAVIYLFIHLFTYVPNSSDISCMYMHLITPIPFQNRDEHISSHYCDGGIQSSVIL